MKKTDVVLPGLTSTALGIARCLKGENVRILAFGHKAPGHKIPMIYSNIPDQKLVVPSNENVVTTLINVRDRFDDDPVLLLSEDRHVTEISLNRHVLGRYRLSLPSHETVISLMDKSRFAMLAERMGWLTPRSIKIDRSVEMDKLSREIRFPIALKAYMAPSMLITDSRQLESALSAFNELNWSSVLAQQWIPGDDSSLHFCFVYFDKNSVPVSVMTAQKIRQWRPNEGKTSLCRTVENTAIEEQTIKIFRALNYVGFGSIEYKYNSIDGKYYIMEPTVGRFNLQVALCRAAGVNLPAVAVSCALNETPIHRRQRNNVWWIHESHDLFSRFHRRQRVRRSYLWQLFTAQARVLFARSDPWPFFASVMSFARARSWSAISRLLRSSR